MRMTELKAFAFIVPLIVILAYSILLSITGVVVLLVIMKVILPTMNMVNVYLRRNTKMVAVSAQRYNLTKVIGLIGNEKEHSVGSHGLLYQGKKRRPNDLAVTHIRMGENAETISQSETVHATEIDANNVLNGISTLCADKLEKIEERTLPLIEEEEITCKPIFTTTNYTTTLQTYKYMETIYMDELHKYEKMTFLVHHLLNDSNGALDRFDYMHDKTEYRQKGPDGKHFSNVFQHNEMEKRNDIEVYVPDTDILDSQSWMDLNVDSERRNAWKGNLESNVQQMNKDICLVEKKYSFSANTTDMYFLRKMQHKLHQECTHSLDYLGQLIFSNEWTSINAGVMRVYKDFMHFDERIVLANEVNCLQNDPHRDERKPDREHNVFSNDYGELELTIHGENETDPSMQEAMYNIRNEGETDVLDVDSDLSSNVVSYDISHSYESGLIGSVEKLEMRFSSINEREMGNCEEHSVIKSVHLCKLTVFTSIDKNSVCQISHGMIETVFEESNKTTYMNEYTSHLHMSEDRRQVSPDTERRIFRSMNANIVTYMYMDVNCLEKYRYVYQKLQVTELNSLNIDGVFQCGFSNRTTNSIGNESKASAPGREIVNCDAYVLDGHYYYAKMTFILNEGLARLYESKFERDLEYCGYRFKEVKVYSNSNVVALQGMKNVDQRSIAAPHQQREWTNCDPPKQVIMDRIGSLNEGTVPSSGSDVIFYEVMKNDLLAYGGTKDETETAEGGFDESQRCGTRNDNKCKRSDSQDEYELTLCDIKEMSTPKHDAKYGMIAYSEENDSDTGIDASVNKFRREHVVNEWNDNVNNEGKIDSCDDYGSMSDEYFENVEDEAERTDGSLVKNPATNSKQSGDFAGTPKTQENNGYQALENQLQVEMGISPSVKGKGGIENIKPNTLDKDTFFSESNVGNTITGSYCKNDDVTAIENNQVDGKKASNTREQFSDSSHQKIDKVQIESSLIDKTNMKTENIPMPYLLKLFNPSLKMNSSKKFIHSYSGETQIGKTKPLSALNRHMFWNDNDFSYTVYPVSGDRIQIVDNRKRLETFRFSTFDKYRGNGKTMLLAYNGFVHEHRNGPCYTICHFCNKSCSNWQEDSDIDVEHRRTNPECPLVCGTSDNVPWFQDNGSNGTIVNGNIDSHRYIRVPAVAEVITPTGPYIDISRRIVHLGRERPRQNIQADHGMSNQFGVRVRPSPPEQPIPIPATCHHCRKQPGRVLCQHLTLCEQCQTSGISCPQC